MPTRTLADRIKLGMASKGIASPSALGRKMKVNRQTVNRWCNGEGQNPEPRMLVKLAKALGVDIVWLATNEGEMQPPGPPPPEENEVFSIYQALANQPRALKAWIRNGREILDMMGIRTSTNHPISRQS